MGNKYICTICGHVGYPVKRYKGSFLVELALWLCLGLPGLIYTIWRSNSGYYACPKCNNPGMIPIDTPMGKKLLKNLSDDFDS